MKHTYRYFQIWQPSYNRYIGNHPNINKINNAIKHTYQNFKQLFEQNAENKFNVETHIKIMYGGYLNKNHKLITNNANENNTKQLWLGVKKLKTVN